MRNSPDLAFGGNGKAQLTPEQKGLKRLKRELADQNGARHLKKAMSIFSVSDRKSTNSRRTILKSFRLG
jgi:hypothetical protein